jgi:hypothetical protein
MLARVCCVVVCSVIGCSPAFAQTAAGLPSFDEGPFLATAGVFFADSSRGVGAGFTGGSNDLFAGIGVGVARVDGLDARAVSFDVHVGTSIPIDGNSRVFLAPVAGASFTSGPDVGEIDVTVAGLRGGARLGFIAHEMGDLSFIPTAGFDLAYARLSTDIDDVDVGDTYGIIRLGVGLLFNQQWSVVPALNMPVGRDGADVEFAILAGFNLGAR